MNINWKKATPYLVALGIFIILPFIYANPVLDGQVLNQSDIIFYKGMSKELHDHEERFGEYPQWTGRAFSGMPSFTITAYYPTNAALHILIFIRNVLPEPVSFLFLLMVGFYLLLLSFRVDPWLSIIGAIAFAFSSNMLISIEAGHNTKVMSIACMPGVIAGLIFAFNNKYYIGGITAALFTALLIAAGHFQIVYYALLVCIIVGIAYLVKAIMDKDLKTYGISLGVLLLAAVVAVLPNFSTLYNTYVHSQESMRGGGSELKAEEGATGLDISYALDDWSFGVAESFTLMFPFFEGGSSTEKVEPGSPLHDAFQKYLGREIGEPLQAPLYMGPQRFTSPIYLGASVILLFFIGLFLIKGINKWWIMAAAVLSLFIAWGSHFIAFNSLLFYNFPLFSKFRNPAMALNIIGMAVPLLGFLALNRFYKNRVDTDNFNALKLGAIATGVVFLIVAFIGFTSNFDGHMDSAQNWARSYAEQVFQGQGMEAQAQNFRAELITAIQDTREQFFWNSFIRSLILVLIVLALLYFYLKGKVSSLILIIGLGIVITYDLWNIGNRYLNEESFVEESNYLRPFNLTPADQAILQDRDPSYRVLNMTGGVFSDAITPYHHKSVLGYSATKVQLYQDLIENELGKEVQQLYQIFSAASDQQTLDQRVKNELPVLNMLNTRYIILSPQAQGVYRNPHALGNAWFVSEVELVNSAREEMDKLGTIDPARKALTRSENSGQLSSSYDLDPSATIQLTSYEPETLRYQTMNPANGFAVFSEVYYETGWNAYIDGEQVPIYKVNYALRGIEIPAGEHEVVIIFEPKSYSIGNKVSLAGSAIFLIFILGLAGYKYNEQKKQKAASKKVK